jgi:hypothetical protein
VAGKLHLSVHALFSPLAFFSIVIIEIELAEAAGGAEAAGAEGDQKEQHEGQKDSRSW